jgi:hypothetical protein
MVETKTIDQEIEGLEKRLAKLKAAAKEKPEPKKEPEAKERLTLEVLRVLKTKYNWKFVAGAIFAWFILWLFNH